MMQKAAKKPAQKVTKKVSHLKNLKKRPVTQAKRSHHCEGVQVVNAEKAPAAVGPYVHATKANGMIFVSGQLPLDPKTMKFNSDTDVALQAQQCLTNMKEILIASGSDMNHVLKCTIFLKNMSDFAKVNKVYAENFTEKFPARVCYSVNDLPLGALVEIDAIAVEKAHGEAENCAV